MQVWQVHISKHSSIGDNFPCWTVGNLRTAEAEGRWVANQPHKPSTLHPWSVLYRKDSPWLGPKYHRPWASEISAYIQTPCLGLWSAHAHPEGRALHSFCRSCLSPYTRSTGLFKPTPLPLCIQLWFLHRSTRVATWMLQGLVNTICLHSFSCCTSVLVLTLVPLLARQDTPSCCCSCLGPMEEVHSG